MQVILRQIYGCDQLKTCKPTHLTELNYGKLRKGCQLGPKCKYFLETSEVKDTQRRSAITFLPFRRQQDNFGYCFMFKN